ncbi:DUF2975 domain-containing protein [Winogradskyella maritima]|uniref:DUF2975 domain-containing protein n=1 Tax=Winogradskyella maritima TaxID=1517766 RepID=A0ABV8AEF3_9FLAO|nr:DUF2975 domain-containing protein [Winogradskyella maritima]
MKNYTRPILFVFLILVLAIIGNIIISTIGIFFNHDPFNTGVYASSYDLSLNIKLIFITKAIALTVFIIGTYVLISKLSYLVKGDFFNLILIQSFQKSGRLFLLSGIVGFVASIAGMLNLVVVKDFSSQAYLNIDSKSLYLMLMILGLFLLLFSKVLKRGGQLQTENDLTI